MDSLASHRDAVLRRLRRDGPTSKPLLAQHLSVSLPTVAKLVRLLAQDDLVAEVGQAGSTGGRRAVLIGLKAASCHLIGGTVSNRSLSLSCYDLAGELVGEPVHVQLPPGTAAELIAALVSTIKPLAAASGPRLGGIGLGVSGLVDRDAGACRYLFGRTDDGPFPLAGPLADRFGVPVAAVNDVFAATLAEQRFGVGREQEDFLYLHVGRGVGLGIVLGGRVHGGSRGHGGELGHTLADPDGPVCYCGNYGCLESVASPPAIVRQALGAIEHGASSSIGSRGRGGEVTIDTIFTAADAGDRLACNLLEQAGEHLGVAVAGAANVLEPTHLVLGGRLADASEVLIERIRRAFLSRHLPLLGDKLHVVLSGLGSHAACRGAAEVIFEQAVLTGEREPARRKHA